MPYKKQIITNNKMKKLAYLMLMAFAMSFSFSFDTFAQDKNTAKVVMSADITCENCKKRIEKNLAFEKGVKKLNVDVENKTVTIVYRKDKTSTANLLTALNELGYRSFVKSEE